MDCIIYRIEETDEGHKYTFFVPDGPFENLLETGSSVFPIINATIFFLAGARVVNMCYKATFEGDFPEEEKQSLDLIVNFHNGGVRRLNQMFNI